jgi:drug/metabolite transporter (DMT)-like permease
MLPYLQVFICALFWGLAGPLIKWSELSTFELLSLRLSLPLVLAYIWIRYAEKESVTPLTKALCTISMLSLAGGFLYIGSFSFTSISNVLLLLYTRPVLTTLMASYMLQESIAPRLWGLLIIAFCGALLIICDHEISLQNNDFIGMVLALLAAIVTGLSWAFIKRQSTMGHSPYQILFHQNLLGGIPALCCLPFMISHTSSDIAGISLGIFYAVTIGFLGLILYYRALKVIPLSHAMPITYTELLVALLCGTLYFGETLSLQTLLGGVCIVMSALASIAHGIRSKKS